MKQSEERKCKSKKEKRNGWMEVGRRVGSIVHPAFLPLPATPPPSPAPPPRSPCHPSVGEQRGSGPRVMSRKLPYTC